MNNLPQRKHLPHVVPAWVPQGSWYEITICTTPREENQLANPDNGLKILESAGHYHRQQKWYIHVMLLMPDHLHAIVTFNHQHSYKSVVSNWKSYQKRFRQIEWQGDFFEHRLRNKERFREKFYYILNNPVRAGLVDEPGDWPYVVFGQELDNEMDL